MSKSHVSLAPRLAEVVLVSAVALAAVADAAARPEPAPGDPAVEPRAAVAADHAPAKR